MKLEDSLDDLCVRFIINLPPEELESVERICFQVEEAQWFYEDFIRPLDPSLPSLSLRAFSLRIFQHCPLFSQWSAQHHTTAFAEFLAYKQRVPVRGAIMLNEEMDRVVLVKGWKKGANWSFPRGKINKDEDDLDCAVREVYEETGFDIKEAGLVKEAKDMKYIEVTMREQHMRLYVFRGVPMNTYFEPRTRKEISKIEWYKLTDLPTIKKHKHQDSNGEAQIVNSNKFYMVAPFLNPLKKWIGLQRKTDSLHISYPASDPLAGQHVHQDTFASLQSNSRGPSDLPEVTNIEQQDPDPSSHLKRILNISGPTPQETPISPPSAMPRNDAAKSSALLAFLRSGSTAEMRDTPNTPQEQFIIPPEVSTSSYRQNLQPNPFSSMPAPPSFQVSPETHGFNPSLPQNISYAYRQQQEDAQYPPSRPFPHPGFEHVNTYLRPELERPSQQAIAPYQRTGDPQFSQKNSGPTQVSAIPPASALPTLTNHTRTLLDAFKMGSSQHKTAAQAQVLPPPGLAAVREAQKGQGAAGPPQKLSKISSIDRGLIPGAVLSQNPSTAVRAENELMPGPALPLKSSKVVDPPQAAIRTPKQLPTGSMVGTTIHHPKAEHQASLLNLFRQPSSTFPEIAQMGQPGGESLRLAELAADPASTNNEVQACSSNDAVLNILRGDKGPSKTAQKKHEQKSKHAVVREGETAATISGPLNQPQFDGIMKTLRNPTNGHGRSSVAPNRTLYDPNQPTPVKILARPEDRRSSPGRSPRIPRAMASPKRVSTPKEPKEAPKPFQPQILRRPQTAENQDLRPSFSSGHFPKPTKEQTEMRIAENVSHTALGESLPTPIQNRSSQADSHKQALLSLFNKPAQTAATPPMAQEPISRTSPAPSLPISPLTEAQMQGIDQISTRSRVGSLASTVGGPPRPSIEKRQTTAGDKAFLLGYLGRIASRDS